MPWPGASLRIALLLVVATVGPPGLRAEENVGCLFSERLCLDDEWCYDDFAFGRCLRSTADNNEDDLHRYTLEREALHELSAELRRLFAMGYRWSHGYTQCRLQAMLYAFKHDMTFEPDSCSHLADNDLEGALKSLEGQVELDPKEVAVIKYTPSADDPHGAYADEIYYPPADDTARQALRESILSPNAIELDMEDPYVDYSFTKKNRRIQKRVSSNVGGAFPYDSDMSFPNDDDRFRDPIRYANYDYNPHIEKRDQLKDNNFIIDDDTLQLYAAIKALNDMNLNPWEVKRFLSPKNYERLMELLKESAEGLKKEHQFLYEIYTPEVFSDKDDDYQNTVQDDQNRFTMNYNTPDNFRAGWESKDSLQYKDIEDFPESRVYYDEEDDDVKEKHNNEDGSSIPLEPEVIFRERKTNMMQNLPTIEDLPLEDSFDEQQAQKVLENMHKPEEEDMLPTMMKKEMSIYNNYDRPFESKIFRELNNQQINNKNGMESHAGIYTEGGVVGNPPADENTFEDITPEQQEILLNDDIDRLLEFGFQRHERLDVKKPGPPFDAQITEAAQRVINNIERSNQEHEVLPSMMKKEQYKRRGVHPDREHDSSKHDKEEYVFVSFQNGFKNWKSSNSMLKNISNLLHLESDIFIDGNTDPYKVYFKVNPDNHHKLDATEVVRRIEGIKYKLEEVAGVKVTGIGTANKEELRKQVAMTAVRKDDQFYIVIYMVCGVLGAMIIASALLILIRRHIKSKEKLQGITRPDSEASKDYQDLCRARMAAKGQPAGDTVHGRITSLSRESEQSPSSRSSTSSWSEEPALHNMDISTGHMVLSYMEDHLKNKDRLEQEWVALCAYVAEPCETTIALKKENVGKNRYPEIIPYDHARVILNELSNAAGSDYINASSITDHDPRNPAYIATQGPLPHTAPDFWQLIWEQGAVVVVMLSRLTEGGTAMCHRYWPEEGSELYHIYEVHLVSEHIWCDDYLVRSFYLKNAKTGETRTVTQFHFLSWSESGVPGSTKALLEFRRKVNKSYRGRSCPIVVHCSDGAGRTGTYCLIDMVLSRMAKGAKEIDIAATLEHLRDQRPKMVATKQQFEFVLTAVAEEVHAILKALPPQPPAAAPAQEKEK